MGVKKEQISLSLRNQESIESEYFTTNDLSLNGSWCTFQLYFRLNNHHNHIEPHSLTTHWIIIYMVI